MSESTPEQSLLALFSDQVDVNNVNDLRVCEYAFKNLAIRFINTAWPQVKNLVGVDDLKLQLMVGRFHRDAFGNAAFLKAVETISPGKSELIKKEMGSLSIRINSDAPRKTRVAAAFSLWMSIMKPIYFKGLTSYALPDLWQLEAQTNFFIATSFLRLYGSIEVGVPGEDRKIRMERIFYDYTYRGVNLSSLEMLYCSIFRPTS